MYLRTRYVLMFEDAVRSIGVVCVKGGFAVREEYPERFLEIRFLGGIMIWFIEFEIVCSEFWRKLRCGFETFLVDWFWERDWAKSTYFSLGDWVMKISFECLLISAILDWTELRFSPRGDHYLLSFAWKLRVRFILFTECGVNWYLRRGVGILRIVCIINGICQWISFIGDNWNSCVYKWVLNVLTVFVEFMICSLLVVIRDARRVTNRFLLILF